MSVCAASHSQPAGSVTGNARVTHVWPASLITIFCWSVVDLQCQVHLCCTSKCLSFIYIYIIPFPMPFLDGLSQDIDYSFLYCAVPSWCLSVLYVTVHIFSLQTPAPSLPTLPPLGTHKSVLRLWACFSFVDKSTCITFEISGVRDIVWYLRFCVWLNVTQYDSL